MPGTRSLSTCEGSARRGLAGPVEINWTLQSGLHLYFSDHFPKVGKASSSLLQQRGN